MPTVMTIYGLRVVIYPSDHRPAHVHVEGNGNVGVFNLNCPKGPVALRENHGFTKKDLSRIGDALNNNLSYLCNKWREIHGN